MRERECRPGIFYITVKNGAQQMKIPAQPGQSLLEAMSSAGIAGLNAPCGGKGRCKKCLAVVTGPLCAVETGQVHSADSEVLLICRYEAVGNVAVELPENNALHVVTEGAGDLRTAGEGLGFAVDIGTTTVAALLYDLASGRQIASAGERNAQRSFGADVISRISACSAGHLSTLTRVIQEQLAALGQGLCAGIGRSVDDIVRVSIAGNTVMEHLAAGLDPMSIGVAPFMPQSLFGETMPAETLLPSFAKAEAYLCPCVSGYVGGDITAGLLASGVTDIQSLCLYIDIGTNGEMALIDGKRIISCATAAGPAFEGAEIACGMDGSIGAIDRVKAENGTLSVHVIGEGRAVGLCGSGLVDAVAALLELGIIDETGSMADADELPPTLAERCMTIDGGGKGFRLQDDVYLSAKDVRQVQLAKAALRAGAETLLANMGRTADEIAELIIAGGFGSFMDKRSALRIGLLPPVPPERIRHIGNAAGAGAALALTAEGIRRMGELSARCEYLELSTDRGFMDRYVDCMMFDEP